MHEIGKIIICFNVCLLQLRDELIPLMNRIEPAVKMKVSNRILIISGIDENLNHHL